MYLQFQVSIIFAIINCLLFPVYILGKKQMEWFGFFWNILGNAGLIVLIYRIMKISALGKLKLSEIKSINEKQFLGQKRSSIKLKNPKSRDLMDVKNKTDLKEMKIFCEHIGIETISIQNP